MDQFMAAALDEARQGRAEGGIPIGSVLVHGASPALWNEDIGV